MDLMSTADVRALLNVNENNLHQIQYRGHIKWVKKEGKNVFYNRVDVEAYKAKRDKRGKK
jgi:predicted site-specific integrase-resolvase